MRGNPKNFVILNTNLQKNNTLSGRKMLYDLELL